MNTSRPGPNPVEKRTIVSTVCTIEQITLNIEGVVQGLSDRLQVVLADNIKNTEADPENLKVTNLLSRLTTHEHHLEELCKSISNLIDRLQL